MCMGGGDTGPSAEELYRRKKVDYGDLPSLSMSPMIEEDEEKKDAQKKFGLKKRTLLNLGGTNA